jgi:hypothetical protein
MKKPPPHRLIPCVSRQRSQAIGLMTSPEATDTIMQDTGTHPVQASVRPTALGALAAMAVAIGLVSIVGFGGFGGHDALGGVLVQPPASSSPTPFDAAEPTATGAPSAMTRPDATAVPTARPTAPALSAPPATSVPATSPRATSTPDGDGRDAMPITVDLANATGAAVHVDIVDHTGLLSGAASGTPGDGASVEGYALAVENVDAKTLNLTWIGFPIDNALVLYIDRVDGHLRLLLIQPEPSGTSDAIGFDRELLLSFSRPVSAGSVETFLQGGLDTPG